MHVINAGKKGGPHGYASAPHDIRDFGVSVFRGPGCYRHETSPLTQVRTGAAPSDWWQLVTQRFCRIGQYPQNRITSRSTRDF